MFVGLIALVSMGCRAFPGDGLARPDSSTLEVLAGPKADGGPCADGTWGAIEDVERLLVVDPPEPGATLPAGDAFSNAISVVEADPELDGVALSAGTHTGNIVVETPGFRLVGCGPEETSLLAEDPDQAALTLAGADAFVSGILMDGGSPAIDVSADTTMQDVEILGATVAGIMMDGPIQLTGDQLFIAPSPGQLAQWTVAYGVVVQDGGTALLNDTVIDGALGAGIVSLDSTLHSDGGLVVSGTTPLDDGTLGRGIHATGGQLALTGTSLTDNHDAGLFALNVPSVVLDGVQVTSTRAAAVVGQGTPITGDGFVFAQDLGLEPKGFQVDMHSCTARDNARAAIVADGVTLHTDGATMDGNGDTVVGQGGARVDGDTKGVDAAVALNPAEPPTATPAALIDDHALAFHGTVNAGYLGGDIAAGDLHNASAWFVGTTIDHGLSWQLEPKPSSAAIAYSGESMSDAALEALDTDGDGLDELVVGTPDDDSVEIWSEGAALATFSSPYGGHFGAAVAATTNPQALIAVGAPGDKLMAGSVYIVDPADISNGGITLLDQGDEGGLFGAAVAVTDTMSGTVDVWVGAPGRDSVRLIPEVSALGATAEYVADIDLSHAVQEGCGTELVLGSLVDGASHDAVAITCSRGGAVVVDGDTLAVWARIVDLQLGDGDVAIIDTNGDNIDDLVVGGPRTGYAAGEASGGLLAIYEGPLAAGELGLDDADAVVHGHSPRFGAALQATDDVLLIGEPDNSDTVEDGGAIWLMRLPAPL